MYCDAMACHVMWCGVGGCVGPGELLLEPEELGLDLDLGPAEHAGVVGRLQDSQHNFRGSHEQHDQVSFLSFVTFCLLSVVCCLMSDVCCWTRWTSAPPFG